MKEIAPDFSGLLSGFLLLLIGCLVAVPGPLLAQDDDEEKPQATMTERAYKRSAAGAGTPR